MEEEEEHINDTNTISCDDDKLKELRLEAKHLREKILNERKGKEDVTFRAFMKNIPPLTKMDLKVRRNLKGHLAKIYALHWSLDGQHLVSAAHDGKLIVWDAYTADKRHVVTLKSTWVMDCAYSPSGTLVACGGLDNICSIFDINTKSNAVSAPKRELSAHTGFLSCCRFIDDRQIVTGSGDKTCILWDVSRGRAIQQFVGHTGDIMSLSLSPSDRNVFVTVAIDSLVKLWDVRSGKCVQNFKEHTGDINAVDFYPGGDCVISGGDDANLLLFDLRADALINTYASEHLLCSISSVAFSSSGRVLFAGYDDFDVVAWDSLKTERIAILSSHDNRVSCIGATADGTVLCTGSWDSLLKVWSK